MPELDLDRIHHQRDRRFLGIGWLQARPGNHGLEIQNRYASRGRVADRKADWDAIACVRGFHRTAAGNRQDTARQSERERELSTHGRTSSFELLVCGEAG